MAARPFREPVGVDRERHALDPPARQERQAVDVPVAAHGPAVTSECASSQASAGSSSGLRTGRPCASIQPNRAYHRAVSSVMSPARVAASRTAAARPPGPRRARLRIARPKPIDQGTRRVDEVAVVVRVEDVAVERRTPRRPPPAETSRPRQTAPCAASRGARHWATRATAEASEQGEPGGGDGGRERRGVGPVSRGAGAGERRGVGVGLEAGEAMAGDQPGQAVPDEDPGVPLQDVAPEDRPELVLVGVVRVEPRPDLARPGAGQEGGDDEQAAHEPPARSARHPPAGGGRRQQARQGDQEHRVEGDTQAAPEPECQNVARPTARQAPRAGARTRPRARPPPGGVPR